MLENYKFWCQKTLPLVYDDSLSYYEQLCQVANKLNEVIDTLNSFDENSIAYTDKQINNLKIYCDGKFLNLTTYVNNELTELNNTLRVLINDGDNAQKEYTTKIASDLLKLIENLQKLFNSNNEKMYAWVKSQLQIFELNLSKIMTTIVKNPITQYDDTLQNTLNMMWDYILAQRCLTVFQYDSLGLTVAQYSAYNLTVDQYATMSKVLLAPQNPQTQGLIYSPVTMQWSTAQEVFNQLAALHYLAPTVNVYQAANLTVNDYTAKQLTTQQYAFNGLN